MGNSAHRHLLADWFVHADGVRRGRGLAPHVLSRHAASAGLARKPARRGTLPLYQQKHHRNARSSYSRNHALGPLVRPRWTLPILLPLVLEKNAAARYAG